MFLEKNLYGERVRKGRISIKNQYRGDNLKSSMRLTLQFSLLQSKQIKMSSSRRNRLRILFPTEMVGEKKKIYYGNPESLQISSFFTVYV